MDLRVSSSRPAALPLLALAAACAPLNQPAENHGTGAAPSAGDLRAGDLRSGSVHLAVSCDPALQAEFDTAVALLHSFFYDEARTRFLSIAERDPDCAMAWWGVAMTWYHPLWAPPTPDELSEGAAAAERALALGGATEIEQGLIDAIAKFYLSEEDAVATEASVEQSCHGPRILSNRARCFREGMEAVRAKHPDDVEVTAFTTLAMLGTAPPTDTTYTNQLAATQILEPLFEIHPDHPGIAHYIIHAYDYPSLADRGLKAANRYGEIAPWVPHALHMPSHIYTRLGMWQASIQSNQASADAARDYARRVYGGKATMDELHALDYLEFAYLQTGRETRAREIVDSLRGIVLPAEPNFASAYAIGAIPARWTLERKAWADAAALAMPHPELLRQFPFAESHIEFARAVGAARSGQHDRARKSVQRMAEFRDALKDPKFAWWTDQVEIQRLAAAGWVARADGDAAKAERLLREAAALEDRAGTHPVTPGQILPAREQLGDLLLELDRPTDALAEYERSLESFPNRFNGHYGAALAAERAGLRDTARAHYEHVLAMTRDADGRRDELAHAREYVAEF